MPPERRIYLDNAATSFPKPPGVYDAMVRFGTTIGASPGRGAYTEAVEAGRLLDRCRRRINELINGESPEHVVFTLNTSDALNIAIKGIVTHHRRADRPVHLVTTAMDHNSVLRPYTALADEGVACTRVPVDPSSGLVDPDDVASAIRDDTRLVAVIHGSNVTGTLQPAGTIGRLCRERGVPYLLDAAQTLGHMPVDVRDLHVDLLAFPGHKGLLGPHGTGGLYLRPGLEHIVDTIREGGTGSRSEEDRHPQDLPDKYEPGSHNAVGLVGLSEGVAWILEQGVDALWAHERGLIQRMLDGLRDLPGVQLLGPQTLEDRCGVFAIRVEGFEPEDLAIVLEREFGILARAGIHCAPRAHETFNTHTSGGATRLSFGPFITENDVDHTLDALGQLCRSTNTVSPA